MKSKTTIKLVTGMKSFPLGKEAGKKPAARSKASQKGKTAPPPPKISRTHKPDGVALEDWQRALRRQFGEQQDFVLKNMGAHPLFSEFSLTNPESGKTYKIAIRGEAPGMNYCSCPDYRINNLGTCKHIEFTLAKLSQRCRAIKRLQEGCAPQPQGCGCEWEGRRLPGPGEGPPFPPGCHDPALQAMIGRDENTGKTYLKIPVPEAEALNRIVSGLGQLLAGFMRMNR